LSPSDSWTLLVSGAFELPAEISGTGVGITAGLDCLSGLEGTALTGAGAGAKGGAMFSFITFNYDHTPKMTRTNH